MQDTNQTPAQKAKDLLTKFGIKVIRAKQHSHKKFSITVKYEQRELTQRLLFSMGVRYIGANPIELMNQKKTQIWGQKMPSEKHGDVFDMNSLAFNGISLSII